MNVINISRLSQKSWLTKLYYLWFFLLAVSVFLIIKPTIVMADTLTGSGNVTVSGKVPGPPPTQAAVIQNPVNTQHFTSASITVSGTCPTTNPITVEIYKNSIFAGSTDCQLDGKFSLQISLSSGQNDLIAKVRDSLDQYGPDSQMVRVFLGIIKSTSLSSNNPSSTSNTVIYQTGGSGNNLQIIVDSVFRGTFAGDPLTLNFGIKGGVQPFAVSLNWGDGSNQDLLALPASGFKKVAHLYKNAGIYMIVITAVDSQDNSNFIQTLTIINPKAPVTATSTNQPRVGQSGLDQAWRYLLIGLTILLLIVSFWLGEKYEHHELKTHNELKPPVE